MLSVFQPGMLPGNRVANPVAPPGYVQQAQQNPPASPHVDHPWLGVEYLDGSTAFGPWTTTAFTTIGRSSVSNFFNNHVATMPRNAVGTLYNRLSVWNYRTNPSPSTVITTWPQIYFYRPNSGVAVATWAQFYPYQYPWMDPDIVPIPVRLPRYNRQPNIPLLPRLNPGTDFGFNIPVAPTPVLNPVRSTGRPRGREVKLRMSAAMMGVVLAVNAMGEVIEWVDILAGIAGYPFGRWRNNRSPWVDKLYWLFVEGGIGYVDADEFAKAALMNAIEDRFYGGLGQLSKSAARNFNRQVGFQTGLAL